MFPFPIDFLARWKSEVIRPRRKAGARPPSKRALSQERDYFFFGEKGTRRPRARAVLNSQILGQRAAENRLADAVWLVADSGLKVE